MIPLSAIALRRSGGPAAVCERFRWSRPQPGKASLPSSGAAAPIGARPYTQLQLPTTDH
ncbi:hypothetical protein [Flavobacterium sp. HJ-32-4]|uniref:hypothetical protein n=1 Tax=Flavobacterium sp. HJ-32-4 TaxID=1160795 RepID=UPI001F136512|nr:hypothetical protein [Flavobacterium sp. HJ-32-4]UMY65016.1 hypothetical protein MKO97_10890 [Flavobacterium sp. HJ-32-4]